MGAAGGGGQVPSFVPTGGLFNWSLSGPSTSWANAGTGGSIVPEPGSGAQDDVSWLWMSSKTGVSNTGSATDFIVGRNSAMTGGFSVDLKSSSLTAEAFFQINSFLGTPHYPFMLNDYGSGQNALYVEPYTDTSKVWIVVGGSLQSISTSAAMPLGRPVHVAVTLDRSDAAHVTLATYFDGVQVLSTDLGALGAFSANFSQFLIGYANCPGVASWMCLRNTALSAAQVLANTSTLHSG